MTDPLPRKKFRPRQISPPEAPVGDTPTDLAEEQAATIPYCAAITPSPATHTGNMTKPAAAAVTAMAATDAEESLAPSSPASAGPDTVRSAAALTAANEVPLEVSRYPGVRDLRLYRALENQVDQLDKVERAITDSLITTIPQIEDPVERVRAQAEAMAGLAKVHHQKASYLKLMAELNRRVPEPLRVPPDWLPPPRL